MEIVLFSTLWAENGIDIKNLKKQNVQIRIGTLMQLNDSLEKGKMKLTDEIRRIGHELINEKISGTYKYAPSDDDEGQYEIELESLAAKINDQKVLPYLFTRLFSKTSQMAIVQQGQPAFEQLIKIADVGNLDNKRSVMRIFKLMINDGSHFYTQDFVREKIKDKTFEILNGNEYPDKAAEKNERSYEERMQNIYTNIKKPALDVVVALGDMADIPILENMAKTDQYYEEIPHGYLIYRRMSLEERKKHLDEIIKVLEEHRTKVNAAGGKDNDLVEYYPIREEAKNAIDELTKKK
jgi:hypothetical protein